MGEKVSKLRLDQVLVERGLVESRTQTGREHV